MYSYYLHSLSGSQDSEDSCAQAAHSMEQHSRFYSLEGDTSQHLSTGFGQQYPLPSYGGHSSSLTHQMPRPNSRPSFHPPAESRSRRATLSDHGYYHTDRAFIPLQVQQPYPVISAPISALGAVMPYDGVNDAVIDNCASAHRENLRQSSPAANKFVADLPFDPVLQINAAVPNTNENDPLSIGSFPVPGQTLQLTHRRSVSPSLPLVDTQDIEYAQHRYGKKKCFYRCRFDISGSPCNKWIVGDRTRVLRHLRSHHDLQTGPAAPAFCRWEKCTHSGAMKHENLSRHVVKHLGVKWKCPHCSRLFSRDDAVHRHMERMAPGMEVSEAEVVPGWEAHVITDLQFKRARTG